MKDFLKKIVSWIFLEPIENNTIKTDNFLRVITVNIVSVMGTFYILLFFTFNLIKENIPVWQVAIAYISAFIYFVAFVIIHANKGIKCFDFAKTVVVVNTVIFYGFIYANVNYGYVWSFLFPTIVILILKFHLGLIFCLLYFLFMFFAELAFKVNSLDLFARHACIFWAQVIMISSYETLRAKYSKKLQKDKEKIELLSITDPLTELYNRRYFSHSINREFARAARQKEKLCFLIIDVDRFKNYNDTYGHFQGDKLLTSISEVFKRIAKRSCDLVFRMGGEEFGILLPNTDSNGALLIAERIREEVSEMRVSLLEGIGDTKVTVSIGMACILPKTDEIVEDLLRRADKNLYKAKMSGRNMVVG